MIEKFYISKSKSGDIFFDTNLTEYKDFQNLSQTICAILISEMIGQQTDILKHIFIDLCVLLYANDKDISECISQTRLSTKYNFDTEDKDLQEDKVAEFFIEWNKEDNLDIKKFSLKCLSGLDFYEMMLKFLNQIKNEDYITFIGDNAELTNVKFVHLFHYCIEQSIRSTNEYREHVTTNN